MTLANKPRRELLVEIEGLRFRLEEAEKTLRAIGGGKVNALVVSGPAGGQVSTLQGAEQPYRVLVETMNEGAATLAADGTILYCNNRLADLLQFPLERLIGTQLVSYVSPAYTSVITARLEKCPPECAVDEIALITRAGDCVPVLTSCSLLDLSGSRGVCLVVTDLSQQKRNEEYMASETLACSIIKQAGDAILVCDCEGRIIRASRLAQQMCGEDPMLTPFDELFRLRIVKTEAMFSVLHSLRGGDFENVEVEFTRRDATIFSLLLNASQLKNVQNRTIGFLVTLTDITGRRQAEGAFRESDLKYRTLFNNTLNGLVYGQVLLDAQGHPADCRFLDANDTFVDLTGLEKEAVLERTAREIMPGIDKSPVDFIGVHGKVATSGEETRFEQYSENLKRWYSVFVFSPKKEYFISIFNDITERKQAEEERDWIFEHSLDLLCLIGFDGYHKRVSPSYEKILGWSQAELLSKPLFEFLHPDDLEASRRTLNAHQEGGVANHFENRCLCKDGSYKWLSWNSHPLLKEKLIVCVARDITEQKRGDEVLRASERALAEAQRIANVGSWDLDLESGELIWSRQLCRIFSENPDSFMPSFEAFMARVHPDDRQLVQDVINQAVVDGKPFFDFEHRIVAKDGTHRVILAQADIVSTKAPQSLRLVGTAMDITERKLAEEALGASEDRFRTLFRMLIEGFCIIEMQFGLDGRPYDYRFLEVNPAFEAQIGMQNAQGKLMSELAPEYEAHWFEMYGKVALTGEPARFVDESKVLNRWFDVSAYKVGGSESRKVAILFNDISEAKRAEAVQKKLNEELESRVADRTGELAVTVETLKAEIAEREIAEDSLLRLNRLYLVLSETNHAIICTKDRNLLFNDVCRIAVEDGGFKLAWVGMVEKESSELQVVASYGAIRYLDGIAITANKEPSGLGPTGMSAREGTYCIINDFLGSPLTHPWHERGATYGIRASAGIPLKLEGRVIGVLSLYADEKDFFDQQQIALLKQMGADISFALDNIQRESQRQQAERALHEETAERLRTVETLRENEQMLIHQSRQAAMGEMISNIAHQWRQPLNTLGLSIQELKMIYGFGECTVEFMDQSVSRSMNLIRHMSQTIDDFMNYFKPEKEKARFQVCDTITNTLSLIEDSFKHQRVVINVVTTDEPSIYGYRNEYAQTLLNILNNAKDAITENKIENPRVRITIGSEGDRAVVTVADNAGGIPEEILGKIFDPYFTTKGPQAGTGLGLFMSKSIIEKNLGGSLTVRNVGGGAEFRIEV